ncbi:hypothetical protein F442_01201 [Phytophthora nicotianae P10297]|uniref:RXLR phytopathogen effector protein WY-domain domain-containing protein n=1 Tax=Phytophthora nicotianae P10297 TaxID=1317064 RepID=W3A603_PHYNI|nr:hypothetical protein F442_01201 [Phytophthora nicotianae P10297]
MTILLASSASAHHELTKEMAESPRSPDSTEKAVTVTRFLRDGGTNDDDIAHNEGRGFLSDKFATIAIKSGMKIALKINKAPRHVLEHLVNTGNLLTEKNLFLWLKYVVNYRKKMGSIWADDVYVFKTLSDFLPAEKLPALFKAMGKNPNFRELGEKFAEVNVGILLQCLASW